MKAQSGKWFLWTGSRTWSQPGHGISTASAVQMIVVFRLSSCLCSEYSGWSLKLFCYHVVRAWHCHHQGFVTLQFLKLPSLPPLPLPHPVSYHRHNVSWRINRLYDTCTWDSTISHDTFTWDSTISCSLLSATSAIVPGEDMVRLKNRRWEEQDGRCPHRPYLSRNLVIDISQ